MKFLIAVMMAALIIPATASANNGNPQNCEANPQQPFCNNGPSVTVEQPTEAECPTGGLVLVVADNRYPVCNGINGMPGINGANGSDGINGNNGVNGADGATGSPGLSGQGTPSVGPTVTTNVVVSPPHRPQRCERRFNSKGKLVVVCKRTTCARRTGGKKHRRLVIVCNRPKGLKHA